MKKACDSSSGLIVTLRSTPQGQLLEFSLPREADRYVIEVFDEKGDLVKTLKVENCQTFGSKTINLLKEIGDSNIVLKTGTYKVFVSLYNEKSEFIMRGKTDMQISNPTPPPPVGPTSDPTPCSTAAEPATPVVAPSGATEVTPVETPAGAPVETQASPMMEEFQSLEAALESSPAKVVVTQPALSMVGLNLRVAFDRTMTTKVGIIGTNAKGEIVFTYTEYDVTNEFVARKGFIEGHVRTLPRDNIELIQGEYQIEAVAIDKDGNKSESGKCQLVLTSNMIREIVGTGFAKSAIETKSKPPVSASSGKPEESSIDRIAHQMEELFGKSTIILAGVNATRDEIRFVKERIASLQGEVQKLIEGVSQVSKVNAAVAAQATTAAVATPTTSGSPTVSQHLMQDQIDSLESVGKQLSTLLNTNIVTKAELADVTMAVGALQTEIGEVEKRLSGQIVQLANIMGTGFTGLKSQASANLKTILNHLNTLPAQIAVLAQSSGGQQPQQTTPAVIPSGSTPVPTGAQVTPTPTPPPQAVQPVVVHGGGSWKWILGVLSLVFGIIGIIGLVILGLVVLTKNQGSTPSYQPAPGSKPDVKIVFVPPAAPAPTEDNTVSRRKLRKDPAPEIKKSDGSGQVEDKPAEKPSTKATGHFTSDTINTVVGERRYAPQHTIAYPYQGTEPSRIQYQERERVLFVSTPQLPVTRIYNNGWYGYDSGSVTTTQYWGFPSVSVGLGIGVGHVYGRSYGHSSYTSNHNYYPGRTTVIHPPRQSYQPRPSHPSYMGHGGGRPVSSYKPTTPSRPPIQGPSRGGGRGHP